MLLKLIKDVQHQVKKIIGNIAYKYAIYINIEFMIIKNCVFYNNSQVIYMMIWLCKSGKGRHVNMMKLWSYKNLTELLKRKDEKVNFLKRDQNNEENFIIHINIYK